MNEMDAPRTPITASVLLTNAVGLHARPSVKLTRAAKMFACSVEIATDPAGPWIDAKSPVKIMRIKAPQGTILHVRASGEDAEAAVAHLTALVRRKFDEETPDAPQG